jgi:putative ABC transport system permease protein
MWRATLRSLAARKLRLLLTAVAIVLGVTFVTGTLVLTDTSTRLFDDQFAQATSGIDLVVRDAATFGAAMGVEVDRDPVPDAVLERIRDTTGVTGAEGVVRGSAMLVADGDAIVPSGASVGLSWGPAPYNPFLLRAGTPPAGDRDVVVDQATAEAEGLTIGDRVDIALEDGLRGFEVVGIAGFGDAPGIPNATVAIFTPAVGQELFDLRGGWSEIQVVAGAVDLEELQGRLSEELGSGYEIATSTDTASASAAAAQAQLLYLRVMLLALAATALVVGGFMIANTFAIVVSQRTREFATLRSLGASRRQVLTSVLTEAVALGVVASIAGVALGIVAATGLRSLSGAFGVVIPDGALVVVPRTLLVGVALGVVVTVLSAIVPARRAARTSPVAAMRDHDTSTRPVSRRRVVLGTVLLGAGATALAAAATSRSVPLVGLGGLAALVGTTVLAPVFAGRLASAIGRLGGGGLVTRLARVNVRRAHRRTAATSTALALGLAVVTFMTVVAGSARAAIADGVDDVIRAELLVQSARGEMLGGLSPHVHHRVSEVPGVAVASRMRFGHWVSGGATKALTAIDPATFEQVADLTMLDGVISDLDGGGIVLAENLARRHGVHVGDRLPMRFSRTGDQALEVVGVFDADETWAVATGYLISLASYAEHFAEDLDVSVFLALEEHADLEAVRAEVEAALVEFPTAVVHDQAEATAERSGMVDAMLGLVTVLLLLAVLIALLGITNTLALSIVERTREIGLLRAVGTSRTQVGRMVRVEAALMAIVGGLVGIALGTVLAAATVRALGGTIVIPLTIPVAQLAVYLVVAAIGGVLAGLVPGRRAASLDVLDAIATG